jgi:hypothetical protein
MLHYYGDKLAMSLGQEAKFYIPLYQKPGEQTVLVPFIDLGKNRKRFVKFEKLAGISEWVFVDLID